MLIGYASMLIAFSLVFVGIRNYRDKFNEGVISFGKAFKIGIMIVLIASTMYVVAWLIDYFFFIPDFFNRIGIILYLLLHIRGIHIAHQLPYATLHHSSGRHSFVKHGIHIFLREYFFNRFSIAIA
jgi:hypothetical protein